MPEITLESLAARVAALEKILTEQKVAQPGKRKDWRLSVGMFDDDPDFVREVIAEGQAIREAEREAARRGLTE
jgi:hypothetical protein